MVHDSIILDSLVAEMDRLKNIKNTEIVKELVEAIGGVNSWLEELCDVAGIKAEVVDILDGRPAVIVVDDWGLKLYRDIVISVDPVIRKEKGTCTMSVDEIKFVYSHMPDILWQLREKLGAKVERFNSHTETLEKIAEMERVTVGLNSVYDSVKSKLREIDPDVGPVSRYEPEKPKLVIDMKLDERWPEK